MTHPSAIRTPATPAREVVHRSTERPLPTGSAAGGRSSRSPLRGHSSPALLTVLLVLVLSVGAGVAAAGSAGAPKGSAGGPAGSAATSAPEAAGAAPAHTPTGGPGSNEAGSTAARPSSAGPESAGPDSAGPDGAGPAGADRSGTAPGLSGTGSTAAGDVAREAGQGAAAGEAALLNHGRLDPRLTTRSTAAPGLTGSAAPQEFAPLHLGDLAAAVILVVAVALLFGVGRMMLRLFAVLAAVVEVTAKIGSSLTVLMAVLGLVIVAVVVAH